MKYAHAYFIPHDLTRLAQYKNIWIAMVAKSLSIAHTYAWNKREKEPTQTHTHTCMHGEESAFDS